MPALSTFEIALLLTKSIREVSASAPATDSDPVSISAPIVQLA